MKLKISMMMYALGYASIAVSAARYLSSDHGDKERDGLFLGHWAPTFFVLAKVAEDREQRGQKVISLDWEA